MAENSSKRVTEPGEAEPGAPRAGETRRMTTNQQLIWLGQQLHPDVPLYNMIQVFAIDGAIDPDLFAAAFESLVRASDVMRTTIEVSDGVPWQHVAESVDASIDVVDLSSLAEPDAALAAWLEQRKRRILKLDERLFDCALVKTGDDAFTWYLCQHHLITDGQSFALTFRYMSERYALAAAGRLEDAPGLPAYADYVEHERSFLQSEQSRQAREYWQRQIESRRPATDFYGARTSDAGNRTRRAVLELGPQRSRAIRDIAATEPFSLLSPNLSLHCLWTTLVLTALHRITGETDLRLGMPFEARPTPQFKQTVGLFIEIGVLNASVPPDATFVSLNENVMEQVFSGLKNAQPGISSAEMNNAYAVLLNYVTAGMDDFAGRPVRTQWLHAGYGDSKHAIRVQVCDFDRTGSFALHFDVNERIFDDERQTWLLNQFDKVVDAFIEEPGRAIGSFDLLTDAERRTTVRDFNASAAALTDATSVVSLFEARADSAPDAVAAIEGERSWTYAALNAHANRIAACLRERGVRNGDRVAIRLPRSMELLAAVWGTLKAGAAFVPIDVANPPKRVLELLEDLDPALIVVSDEFAGSAALSEGAPVLNMETAALDAYPADNRSAGISGDDIAYFIYTSGSTGRPKAAMLGHAGLLNYVCWAARTYLRDESLDFPLYSSIAFDLTLTSMFVPLVSGGAVRIYRDDTDAPGLEVLDVFADDAVDVVKLTPAHLELLRSHGSEFQRIRTLILGGEDLKTRSVRSFLDAVGRDVAIYNEYGPTEATVGCMVHRYDPETDVGVSVPIGVPAANVAIHVRDAYDRPVPHGVVGEMVIAGPGVALGYWNREDLTKERFCAGEGSGERLYRTGDLARWTSNGLEFLGRADEQVKIRGARIELGEIENTLLAHPGVEAAAVTVQRASGAGDVTHCVSCGLSSNYPNAAFDEAGVCADCRDYARLKNEVDRYFGTPEQLRGLLEKIRSERGEGGYDCIVLTSGGKDSTYMLYQLVREFGVKPLVFTLDNGYLSDRAIGNVRQACDDLGIDLEVGSTPHMDRIFADSLRRHCNVCNGCFKTIYTLSMGLARRLGISTIVTGLSRGQMFETRLTDTFRARQFDPDTIDRLIMDARKVYHRTSDAVYELLETDLFSNERIFDEVSFLDFYRYVDVGLDEVYQYLEKQTVWERPEDTGRSTNCLINDVGIYVHTRTRGYHNYALPYSWDVRLGHKNRSTAMQELDDSIDEARVQTILADIGFDDTVVRESAGSDRLVGYVVGAAAHEPDEVYEFLRERLPNYMVPAQLVALDALPLTRNGKVDRSRLPVAVRERPELDTRFVAPSTPLQADLHAIWSEVMDLPQIGINDDFFQLGGDSVMSIRIAAQAQELGLEMTPRQLFLTPTIAQLADALMADVPRAAAKDARGDDDFADSGIAADLERLRDLVGEAVFAEFEDVYPLTPIQEGFLYHATAAPQAGAYIGQVNCSLTGPIDVDRLEQAWRRTVARQPVLRTRFFWDQLDRPLQAVCRSCSPHWQVVDWRDRQGDAVDSELAALRASLHARGLDLSTDALMRVTLVLCADDRGFLIWDVHHILLDGWSAFPVIGEWLRHYDALLGGKDAALPTSRPFADFVRWQANLDTSASDAFWRDYLAGLEEATPLCRTPPVDSAEEGTLQVEFDLGSARSAALDALARKHRVTLNTVFQAAWAMLVGRHAGTSDVVFGMTVSGRNIELAGAESIVGLLLNSLPVRLQTVDDLTVAEWLPQVQDTLSRLGQHEATALSDIRRVSDLPSDQELFDSVLVFENYPSAIDRAGAALTVGPLEFNTPSHYPLALLVFPGRVVKCLFVFNGARFRQTEIERMAGQLLTILDAMVANPESRLGNLPVLPPLEREQILAASNPSPVTDPGALLCDMIVEQCARRPDATAITYGRGKLSYGELNQRATSLARRLTAIGCGHLVAIEATRSPDTVIGMLGIWKAGAAFVPVDPDHPRSRLHSIVADARVQAIVTTRASTLVTPAELTRVHLDDPGDCEDDVPLPSPSPDDLAYVLYTSGSTGRPKGVKVSHRNIALSTAARPRYYPGRVERFLMLPSFGFDSSMAGLFWTLSEGGELLLPDAGRQQDLVHLADLIDRRRVSHLLTLPSVYEALLDAANPEALRSLRIAIVAGETCTPAVYAAHRRICPHAELYNEYGPTEGTVWSHVYRFPGDFDATAVPIGKPLDHVRQYVLNQQLGLAPVGVPGELFLGGAAIAQGYLGDDELTAERFVELPGIPGVASRERFYRTGDLVRFREDGELEFLGRNDEQIKVRGFRVEPAEIEGALLAHPELDGAVVVNSDAKPGRLVAWYSAAGPIRAEALRECVLESLPGFMLPDSFVHCDDFPRLPNGKIDRRAISRQSPDDGDRSGRYREAETAIQRSLAQLWSAALGCERIGIGDNFFDLGGDSLTAMRLAARAHRQGLIITPADIMAHPTIADLAGRVRSTTSQAARESIVTPERFSLAGLGDDELDELLDELEG